jgi:ppGpp synthetase/RelA/SpoT-type nucleotidyltranferase
VGRLKTVESVGEKIEMGRYSSFSEIDDLVAFTLVIPNPRLEAETLDFCQKVFDVARVRGKKDTRKPPEFFRFDSTRVIARLRPPADLGPRIAVSVFDYLFEIQIRTAFEHAWSVATHDLVYKGSTIDWRRIRLAAQLKATSEGLDAAIGAFDHLAQAVEESPWENLRGKILVSEFAEDLFVQAKLPSTLRPASMSRFAENLCELVRDIHPKQDLQDCLRVIKEEIERLRTASVPASLSLYQLFFGILCKRGMIGKVKNIPCHITFELAAVYPETKDKASSAFDYDK